MKKLLLIIGLVALTLNVNAQRYYATNSLAAGDHQVLGPSSPIVMSEITVYGTNAAPVLIHLYDGWLINTNAAYTNYTAALTDVVSTVITSSGSTNTFTNSVWKTTANAVAAGNVQATPVATLLVPATPDAQTYQLPLVFAKGLHVSNSTAGLSFVVKYRNP
jgi:hypothetical protein